MYPNGDLARLDAHKTALRRRIGARREDCAAALRGVERPLAWLDRAVALWRRLRPFAALAAIPLTLLAKRTLLPRLRILGTLVKWAPVIFGAGRAFSALHRPVRP
jgi:hypothetical protein